MPIALPSVGDDEWQALKGPIESGWLTQGPKVAEFESAFARRHGARRAIAVTSCTTGLHLALTAMGIGPGDEVIVPSFTWVATANAVLHCGADLVLADVDTDTYNVTPDTVAAVATERTRAVIPVHLFGLCADVDALRSVVPSQVQVLEDAACAVGAALRGRSAGSLGEAAVFSLHPRKVITTGEGGVVTTSDTTLAQRAETLRNHGASIPEEIRHGGSRPHAMPDHDVLGFNYRMSDLQGALGLSQLAKLDGLIVQRQAWADRYREALSDIAWLTPPSVPDEYRHGWQAYVCTVDQECAPRSRDDIMDSLHACGVQSRPGTHAVHMLKYYRQRFGYQPEDFPVSRACAEWTLAIPLHNRLTVEDFEHVVKSLKAL